MLPARENEQVLDDQDHKKYLSIVGSLLYLAVCTRPDVIFNVSVLARQVHAPNSRRLALTKQVMRFVAGTVDVGLLYRVFFQCHPVIWLHQLTPIGAYAERHGCPFQDG